ncbi:MAG TPA: Vms1/Ankzf1 family peptidyl-tRNA hydrolase [Vicinamibacterales bacterium]|nr:Vms1/Ankzf1 family peptidyl-tRNA hydrolase [Vicinamibacterales bacterium]
MPQLDQLSEQLDRLAAFEPGPFPVVSLYLNLQADGRGKDNVDPFLKKEFAERLRTYAADAPELGSLENDRQKIVEYVGGRSASANGLVVFASSGSDLFEAIQVSAPIDDHKLFINDRPHLYPLAKLLDRYPRYLVLLADTHSARIFVIAVNAVERTERIEGTKTKHHKMGGWSQARYQRHAENYHLQHAKEVADTVARIVRAEGIDRIVVRGDETILPLLRDQFPKEVSDCIVDTVRLELHAPEKDVIETTIAALRQKDGEDDRERVDQLMNAYRGSGLACVGVEAVKKAFTLGQIDELLISGTPKAFDETTADELVSQARNTSARIRVIEDGSMLESVGDAGAFLRFKV